MMTDCVDCAEVIRGFSPELADAIESIGRLPSGRMNPYLDQAMMFDLWLGHQHREHVSQNGIASPHP